MLQRKSTKSPLDIVKETIWSLVLYFVYFFTLLFWMRFIGVCAQGNRGVVVNNQKFDDSSGIQYVQTNTVTTLKPSMVAPSVTSQAPIQSTTKRPPTTKSSLVTIKDFQPQTSKNFNYQVQSTSLPVFNSEIIKQLKRPHHRVNNLIGLQNIWHQNKSDMEKLDQIIQKLNQTGNLSKINVYNLTDSTSTNTSTTKKPPRNITYVRPYENHQKDSKELKVQFVLDCDLKDGASSTTLKKTIPTSVIPTSIFPSSAVKKVPILYPTNLNVFDQRIPTKTPLRYPYTKQNIVYYLSTKRPVVVTTKKPRVKNVYVDPPVVSAISNTFESVYNMFESAFTDEVKSNSKTRKNPKKHAIKRSTEHNPIIAPTRAPNYRYTQSYLDQKGQKLTTNIHVTSEYAGKDPEPAPPTNVQNNIGSDSYEDDYYYDDDEDDDDDDDDDVDDDDDDDEDDDDNAVNNNIREEEDDYDDDYDFSLGGGSYDDDSDEDVYSGPPPNKIDVQKRVKKKKLKKSKTNKNSESDEDGLGFSKFSMSNMGNYFRRTYDSITDFLPSISIFDWGDDDDDDDEDSSKIRKPKLKNSLYSKDRFPPNRLEAQEKSKKWYDKFFFGSEEVETITPPAPIKSTTESGFFNWFGAEESTEKLPAIEPQSEQGWFSNIFAGGTQTTTTPTVTSASAEVTTEKSAIYDGKKWLEMLTAQMATMNTLTSTASTMNRTTALKRIKYDDYQVWRIMPSTHAHLEFLREYKKSDENEHMLWLKGPSMRGPTDILVPPDINKEVQEVLEYEAIPYEVVVWDLEKAIKYENPIMSRRQKIELEKEQGHPMTWYRYHTFEDIAIYLDYLQLTYPDIVELIHIGRSFEGRPLMVVKVSFDATESEILSQINSKKNRATLKSRKKKKVIRPGIFIEAGVHGREWITPAVATWILKELVKHNNTEDGSTEKEMLRSVDWYILPVSNPDGYEYSLNYDRMWRKTRSKLPENASMLNQALNWLKRDPTTPAAVCYGTDPDRNYDVEWQKNGSPSACSEFYAGPKPFSEPETRSLATFLEDNKHSIHLFLSLHSYGQFITYPTTINSTLDTSQRSNDLRDMAEVAVNALRDFASSARYTVDTTHEMGSTKSGTSTDYAMHTIGIKYSYTIELRDTGTQGFLLSPSYIDTTGLEAFEMIKAMVDYI